MASFKFKLQSILNIKIQMEDALKNKIAKAIRCLEEEKDILKNIKEEQKKCMLDISSESSNGVTVERLRNYNAYISFLKEKVLNQTKRVKSSQEVVDKYREELIQASKEKKMLETLKEKQFNEYLKEEEKNEQKRLDEVVSYKETAKRG
ncbi:MAG: flagellar export protein FliJ [Deltaproteobacteria bacterium]